MKERASYKFPFRPDKPFKWKSFTVISFLLITAPIAFDACEKPERVVQVLTIEPSTDDVSFTTAILKGEITDMGSDPIEEHGILVSENSTPRVGNSIAVNLGMRSSRGSFQVNAINLAINTTYYFRAYARVNDKDIYADAIKQFKTKSCNLVTVTTTAVSSVLSGSAQSGGNVVEDGGAPVTSRGICWSTSTNPSIDADTTINGAGVGSFSSIITGLTNNTTYHVRAYAINAAGTAYGNDVYFTTTGIPVVTTLAISLITASSASAGGEVVSDRGDSVTIRGVCWNTTLNPTTDNPHISSGDGTGTYTCTITGLTSETTYHVRAYATNSIGTAYGEDVYFTTLGILSVSTASVSSITARSARSGGTVNSDGGIGVTARGVCWSTDLNPTIMNSHTTDGVGLGFFPSDIINLNPGTTYHVRAYATNSVATSYGEDISFKTTSLPTITTASITSITDTTAISGGNVTSDGGDEVTAKGVCWSLSANPTISGAHTTDGTGEGPFISSMIKLTSGLNYHVRAYATNSAGTAYGADFLFTTLSIPVLSTIIITSFTPTTAKSGGNITNDGGAPVTARGVCWNTTGNPTISDNKTDDGQGGGIFQSDLIGLVQTTSYYVRAFATNIVGTAYGNVVSFTTDFLCGTRFLDRRDNKNYWTTEIGNQCWFAENLNVGTMIDGSLEQANNTVLEKYCYDNLESNCNTYGGLYQWNEMMQYTELESPKGVCPTGWHIPSDNEWKILEVTLGMSQATADLAGWRGTTEGGKLKATGTAYWNPPNEGATNSSLFTALPSGNRTSDGTFTGKGSFTDFWTSTSLLDTRALYRYLNSTYSQIQRIDGIKQYATPIRCLRDQ